MEDPNITMEEYIRLEDEKAHRRGKVYNWDNATYGKIWYDEDLHDLRSVENEFSAIVLNDELTSEVTLSSEPTVSPLNDNQIYFRISFNEFDDEDYTGDVGDDGVGDGVGCAMVAPVEEGLGGGCGGIVGGDSIDRTGGDKFMIVFIDDILIYSRTREEHEMHFGHVINHDGIHVDPSKIEVVKKWKALELYPKVIGERPEEKVRHLRSAKTKEQKKEDIVMVRNFLEVFLDNLSGLPPY
nr:hypothetical protein [Tanacetum cinerariifolium]